MMTSGSISGERRCVWVNGAIIVGGGPAGLAVAACLRARGVPSLVLERAGCLASLWRCRTYDRLRLHLPKRFCSLPMLPLPSDLPEYPTRDQFVGYLQSYAEAFRVEARLGERVEQARFQGVWRVLTAGGVEYVGRWLVAATGENAEPVVPEWEGQRDYGGVVMHAAEYRSGEAFRGKRVVVVGCGNSGMELCLDLCHHGAFPCMVVRDSVHVLPREILGMSTFHLSLMMSKYLPLRLVDRILILASWTAFGPMSRYGLKRPSAGPLELKHKEGKTPVLDLGALRKIKSGEIRVVPGIKRFTAAGVELVDGSTVDAEAVVLATGYRSNVPSWLKEGEMFGKDGYPRESFPNGWKGRNGLYAVGFTRRGLLGASADAVRIADDIEREWKEEMRHTRSKLESAQPKTCMSHATYVPKNMM